MYGGIISTFLDGDRQPSCVGKVVSLMWTAAVLKHVVGVEYPWSMTLPGVDCLAPVVIGDGAGAATLLDNWLNEWDL